MGIIKDRNGEWLGRIDPDGSFYKRNGERAGKIDIKTGQIFKANGELSGQFDKRSVEDITALVYNYLKNQK